MLIAGVEAGKLICPLPYETVWESTPLSEDRYKRVRELQAQLSCGVSFKPFSRLIAEETLALVRPGTDIAPFELGDWDSLRAGLVGRASRDQFLNFKQGLKSQLAALPIKYDNKGLPFAKLEKLIHLKETADLFCSLERLQRDEPLSPNCAYTADVCKFLVANAISDEEITKLKELIRYHRYEVIPVLFYYSRLLTQFEFDLLRKGRPQEPNDIDDLTRVATALWASDIYICDKEMAEVCKKAKIQEFTPTLIFSVGQSEAFLKHLQSSLSAPKEIGT
jgi:hypothetical protein